MAAVSSSVVDHFFVYNWRKQYSWMKADDAKEFKELKNEKLVGGDQCAGGRGQDCVAVFAGMGIHSDDERAAMRDDRHGGSCFLPRRE